MSEVLPLLYLRGLSTNDFGPALKELLGEEASGLSSTAITDILSQNVPLEDVQYLAGHSDPRATQIYDRRRRHITRNIVERVSK